MLLAVLRSGVQHSAVRRKLLLVDAERTEDAGGTVSVTLTQCFPASRPPTTTPTYMKRAQVHRCKRREQRWTHTEQMQFSRTCKLDVAL
jgi:hypothetical protein